MTDCHTALEYGSKSENRCACSQPTLYPDELVSDQELSSFVITSQPSTKSNWDQILDDNTDPKDPLTQHNNTDMREHWFGTERSIVELQHAKKRRRRILNRPKQDSKITSAVRLVDAAFRAMLGDTRERSSAGIRLTESSDKPRLAELCPSLFSVGYRQASIS